MIRCPLCARLYPVSAIMPIRCPCGVTLGAPATPLSEPPITAKEESCAVNFNVYLCRFGCEHYDPVNDSCREVIRIGVEKGQARAGQINWLHNNPSARCPVEKFDGPTEPTAVMAQIMPVVVARLRSPQNREHYLTNHKPSNQAISPNDIQPSPP